LGPFQPELGALRPDTRRLDRILQRRPVIDHVEVEQL
jgi:hypothetical protein